MHSYYVATHLLIIEELLAKILENQTGKPVSETMAEITKKVNEVMTSIEQDPNL